MSPNSLMTKQQQDIKEFDEEVRYRTFLIVQYLVLDWKIVHEYWSKN